MRNINPLTANSFFTSLFEDEPAYLQMLSHLCRDPRKLATAFGLQFHPVWTAVLEQAETRPTKDKMGKVLACLMYSMDPQAQNAHK